MIMAKSPEAIKAYTLVQGLQKRFVDKLNRLSSQLGENKKFEEVLWVRDEGQHGGGNRFEAKDNILFNTASVNVSQVHYDDDSSKKLQSATAISTIIHPKKPQVPSIHIHISQTQMRDGSSYYRIMADLNPSIENSSDTEFFNRAVKKLSKDTFEEGVAQGDKYFYIPALNRHRGVSHFYLENYKTSNADEDYNFADNFGKGIIDSYIDIIENAITHRTTFSVQDIIKQLDYHTLYLFQVLTLDRGTTSGLLIHNQNDKGIMGSLPSFVDRKLLESWATKVDKPQNELIENLVSVIDEKGIIDIKTKEKLAQVVREHYTKYPEALKMQASGNTIPTTVSNHEKS